ncbi:helix-turn-helix transcriptional regulator [Elizabethkingia anophelis]|uniref:helix-turn-helix transcriptional regulator n=1 Tax=Elizabethkingia miricola TaxID=172045 RepID=UPI0021A9220E|nr:helix-turn-helix transcriptional regulator [Elizabethkingia miricola]MCT4326171.1 helix-turn-helix transcriptional regulator [Elizabethkingia anophelis]WQM39394.1 helix-turn-helix transcriptional regulator [Elizabethkingia miricola]
MQEYSNEEIEALGLQIGCLIRLGRLRKKLSQEELGLLIGSNNTTVGRIERYENNTNWKHLIKVCQALEIDFQSLFHLQPLNKILSTIQECFKLEEKLTTQKKQYYSDLELEAKKIFIKIRS